MCPLSNSPNAAHNLQIRPGEFTIYAQILESTIAGFGATFASFASIYRKPLLTQKA
jgi:hypothetical protein